MVAMMNDIYALADQELVWAQTNAGEMRYELQGDNRIVASLAPNKQGSGVIARSANSIWLFSQSGLVNPKVIIKTGVNKIDYAQFTKHWLGRAGTLTIDRTTEYRFECSKFPCQEKVWLDSHDRVLVRMIPQSENPVLKMIILPLAKEHDALPLLSLLGLYLTIT